MRSRFRSPLRRNERHVQVIARWRDGSDVVPTFPAALPPGGGRATKKVSHGGWSLRASARGRAGPPTARGLLPFLAAALTALLPHLAAQFIDRVRHFLKLSAQLLDARVHLAHLVLDSIRFRRHAARRSAGWRPSSGFPGSAFKLLAQLAGDRFEMFCLVAESGRLEVLHGLHHVLQPLRPRRRHRTALAPAFARLRGPALEAFGFVVPGRTVRFVHVALHAFGRRALGPVRVAVVEFRLEFLRLLEQFLGFVGAAFDFRLPGFLHEPLGIGAGLVRVLCMRRRGENQRGEQREEECWFHIDEGTQTLWLIFRRARNFSMVYEFHRFLFVFLFLSLSL
jgi:hypothetical protein